MTCSGRRSWDTARPAVFIDEVDAVGASRWPCGLARFDADREMQPVLVSGEPARLDGVPEARSFDPSVPVPQAPTAAASLPHWQLARTQSWQRAARTRWTGDIDLDPGGTARHGMDPPRSPRRILSRLT